MALPPLRTAACRAWLGPPLLLVACGTSPRLPAAPVGEEARIEQPAGEPGPDLTVGLSEEVRRKLGPNVLAALAETERVTPVLTVQLRLSSLRLSEETQGTLESLGAKVRSATGNVVVVSVPRDAVAPMGTLGVIERIEEPGPPTLR